jgi:SpoVK/Ycf46/Vps4 family AAA+-type ATPase
MGTLGTTADELERRLCEILSLSARWDSLVLLDEADSVLEERSSNSSIERNAMVSVMLRLVEYHRGILFLTTNRIESIDPAFQTRITLALRYESLDVEGRAQVWKNLLLKSNQCLDFFDVKALSKTELNGREVKNALRLAMALAAEEGSCLTQDLLLETTTIVYSHKSAMKINLKDEKPEGSGCFSSLWR